MTNSDDSRDPLAIAKAQLIAASHDIDLLSGDSKDALALRQALKSLHAALEALLEDARAR